MGFIAFSVLPITGCFQAFGWNTNLDEAATSDRGVFKRRLRRLRRRRHREDSVYQKNRRQQRGGGGFGRRRRRVESKVCDGRFQQSLRQPRTRSQCNLYQICQEEFVGAAAIVLKQEAILLFFFDWNQQCRGHVKREQPFWTTTSGVCRVKDRRNTRWR